ncbi:MAG: molybdopterin-dependent oxidoreductase, partial [Candidatus Binatia bacterium]|nr:molybdopterin-dependent oxidoreductase [Candidatus Binatia bacterium]
SDRAKNLKAKLKDYTPEKTQSITGIHPKTVRELALEIGKAKSVCNITQSNFSKFYHGTLMERAQILVLALCGHFGKRGSGFRAFPFLSPDAYEQFPFMKKPGVEGAKEAEEALAPMVKKFKDEGYTDEMIVYEMIRQAYAGRMWLSGVLFWYHHGGLDALSGQSKKWDKYLKREVDDYMKESLSKGWQYISPEPDQEPRVLFEYGGNILRRVRGYTQLEKVLFPKLKLLITLDWRMSATALSSDIVLPCAGWYEKHDIKWGTPLMPYAHVGGKAVDPLYESKPEHEIFTLIAKKIQEVAKKRGVSTYKGSDGRDRRLDTVYDDLTFNGHYGEKDDEKIAEDFVKISTNLEGVTWEQLKEDGFAKFTNIGKSPATIGNATDIRANETIIPFTWHTDKKIPYPTLTRRMQFYIDQDLYMELGEELPTYKEPPKVGGDHPLVITGGHTRWSIHSSWRDNSYMLRQQRGVPIMYMSVPDAEKRGIQDGEEVEVKNDLDAFQIHAKVSPSVRPGQV